MTMTAQDAAGQAQTPAKRAPRLSPELNEFLHMLNALEGQFNGSGGQVQ